jgi:hypothetical protein
MSQPIILRGRFATVKDTARTLGVSRSQTQELIEMVKKFTQRADAPKKKAQSRAAKATDSTDRSGSQHPFNARVFRDLGVAASIAADEVVLR